MKKFLVFAMVLVSACVLFAADTLPVSDTLIISVGVTGKHTADWALEQIGTVKDWNNITKVGDRTFNGPGEGNQIVVYPSAMTNSAVPVKLTVTGEALSSANVMATDITITATPEGADNNITSVTWDIEDDKDSISWSENKEEVNGNRVISKKLTLVMDEKTYGEALAATDYTAILTLTVQPANA